MSTFSCHLLFDHFQFALIHEPNIPGSYALLLFTASDLASITSHIHSWVLFLLWLHPFILSEVISAMISSSIPGHLSTWRVHLSVSYRFSFSYCSWDSQGKNIEVLCHSLLQWTTFCQVRNGRDLTEAEDIKKRWQGYTEELYKKVLHNPDHHDGVITHLEPDILECEVKWTLGSITTNKASGGDGIPIELFQILKDDTVKVLHSICQ